MWVLKVMVISCPWPKVVYIQNINQIFSETNQNLYESFQVQGNENFVNMMLVT